MPFADFFGQIFAQRGGLFLILIAVEIPSNLAASVLVLFGGSFRLVEVFFCQYLGRFVCLLALL